MRRVARPMATGYGHRGARELTGQTRQDPSHPSTAARAISAMVLAEGVPLPALLAKRRGLVNHPLTKEALFFLLMPVIGSLRTQSGWPRRRKDA